MYSLREYVARELFAAGRRPQYSSNYFDDITCGYGDLDSAGEWMFPLDPAWVDNQRSKTN